MWIRRTIPRTKNLMTKRRKCRAKAGRKARFCSALTVVFDSGGTAVPRFGSFILHNSYIAGIGNYFDSNTDRP